MARRARVPALTAALAAAVALVAGAPAHADDPLVPGQAPPFAATYDDWGEHGLIQDPSARMGKDGDFSFTFSHVHPYDRYNLFVTALPWLEAGFRYTDINNRLYGPESYSGSQTYKDRSFEIKVRLMRESADFPAVAVGVRDLAGTGLFGSEYLVATRRYYNFDITAGLGWGLMATRATFPNPFGLLLHSFKVRQPGNGAGTLAFSEFHGPNVGLFGGVEYHTPIRGLSLKLEWDPDDYQEEPLGNSFQVRSPVNAAVEYQPLSYVDLSAGIERGTTLMLRVSLHANLDSPGVPVQDVPPPTIKPPPTPAPAVGVPLDQSGLPLVGETPAPTLYPGLAVEAAPPAPATVPPAAPPAVPPAPPVAPAPRIEAGASAQNGKPPAEGWSPTGRPLDQTNLPRITAPSTSDAVANLFAGAARLGYVIDDVAINGVTATLTVSPAAGRHPDALRALAALADRSLDVDDTVITRQPPRSVTARGAAETMAAAATTVIPRKAADAQYVRGIDRRLSLAPAPIATAALSQVARQVFDGLHKIGFTGLSFAIRGRHAYLAFTQPKYRNFATAIGRAARVVAAHAPPAVTLITLDLVEDGLTLVSVSLQRQDLDRAIAAEGSPEEIWADARIAGSDPDAPPGVINPKAYPRLTWAIDPRTRQQLGGPNNFLIYQFYVELASELALAPGVSLTGSLGVNLFNNLNQLTLASNSELPHVRSDIAKYLKEGQTGIDRLQADYLFDIAPDWYGRISGGLLEEMFGGVDGEVLYRPYEKRWAIGLDVNHVYQRQYDELFGFLPYQVTTGHLSLYYKLPFYHLLGTLRVGRYLAGDKGATIELSRTFDSGIRIGVFATKTNVSAAQFGEGGFDKGFFISVPLDHFFGEPTRDVASFLYRPLTRDGGQMLDIAKPLYDETRGSDPDALSRGWSHLLE